MFENSNKKDIRRDVSERLAWALFNKDQYGLGLMIEDHYKRLYLLSFDERQAICDAWTILEKGTFNPPFDGEGNNIV